jgi:hypothetical protein
LIIRSTDYGRACSGRDEDEPLIIDLLPTRSMIKVFPALPRS